MKIHKRTRLTLTDREELWKLHCTRKHSQSELAEIFRVSRQTISKILQRCRGENLSLEAVLTSDLEVYNMVSNDSKKLSLRLKKEKVRGEEIQ